MKYVIIQRILPKDQENLSPCYPVLFPDHLSHCEMVPNGCQAISAGFFTLSNHDGFVEVDGKSESLNNLESHAPDAKLIQSWIELGESILIISSIIYLEELSDLINDSDV